MAQKQVSDSPLASLLPDEMVAGGLPDDFDGIVREARYSPWDYNGSIPKPVLAIRLKIERLGLDADADDDERFVLQHWSAGNLAQFRPSSDGVTPNQVADPNVGDMSIPEGFFAIRVGERTALNNNTNAAQLMRSLLDAQVPRDKFRPDVRFMEGLKGHWNRLPPDKKGGQFKDQTPEQKEKADKRDVLVVTRFDGFVAAGAAASTGATGASPAKAGGTGAAGAVPGAVPTTAGANGSVDGKLVEVIRATVKVGAPPIKKSALSGVVLKQFKADKDVNAMVKRVTTTEFLEGLAEFGILFDAEAGTVEAVSLE